MTGCIFAWYGRTYRTTYRLWSAETLHAFNAEVARQDASMMGSALD